MPRFYQLLSETVPIAQRDDRAMNRLRVKVERGISVYRIAGIWHTGKYLSPEIVAAADRVYYGGYLYFVPDDELVEMEAQGIPASRTEDIFIDEFTETF